MKHVILKTLFLLAAFLLNCHGTTNGPVFVVLEKNHWAMVIGADSPSFALYEDGTVIFLKEEADRKYTYYSYQDEFPEQLLKQFIPDNTHSLSNYYGLALATCQTRTFFLWKDKTVETYGEIRHFPRKYLPDPEGCFDYNKSKKMADEEYKREVEEWRKCPADIRKIMDKVISFDHPDAKKWLPEKIEVMVWPYENAPEESIIWPSNWPDLEDKDTKQRGKESYSIYVPSSSYDQLTTFLGTKNKKGAILINGRKMSASIRLPFPHEKKWMGADPHL